MLYITRELHERTNTEIRDKYKLDNMLCIIRELVKCILVHSSSAATLSHSGKRPPAIAQRKLRFKEPGSQDLFGGKPGTPLGTL